MAPSSERPSRRLAEFTSSLEFDKLPPEVQHRAKLHVLDLVGVTVFGAGTPWATTVRHYVRELGGRAEASLVGAQGRLPAAAAALANGTAAHGFEADDYYGPSLVHQGWVIVTALALAERAGASAAQFLAAVVAGYEATARIGAASGPNSVMMRGFHSPAVSGALGAAIAGARLLNLDADRTLDAIGVAASMTGGLMEFTQVDGQSGAMVKHVHAGRAADTGVLAATLASGGYQAPPSAVDGRFGFLRAYGDDPHPDLLSKGLGDVWYTLLSNHKRYPWCGAHHTAIDALLAIRLEQRLENAAIREIRIGVSEKVLAQHNGPGTEDIEAAQYSLPFTTAVAALRDPRDPYIITDALLADPEIVGLSRRVRLYRDPGVHAAWPSSMAAKVAVDLGEGRVVEVTRWDVALMSEDELVAKFHTFAEPVLGHGRTDELRERICSLEREADLSALGHLVQTKRR